jgi:beta propeller repeat protein
MDKEQRLTNTNSDEAQPYADGINSVFVDYASGLSDPNLSLINLVSRRTMRLISDPNKQEEPVLSGNRLVWQDNRSGLWQIYFTEIVLPPVPVLYKVKEGLSVVAVTKGMKDIYADAYSLLNAWKTQFNVRSILVFDPGTGEMLQADWISGAASGSNFNLTENMALMVYSDNSAEVSLGDIPECVSLNFNTGFNLISVPCVPDNYTAFMMIQSMGVDRTISIARYDNISGRWDTAAVLGGTEVVGKDFLIMQGEGYIVYTSGDILNWYP